MSGWLLDTNVLSELRRPKPNRAVVKFVSGELLDRLHVSAATFAEIRFGIELLTDTARRAQLVNWLENTLRPMFSGRVHDLDEEILLAWRLIVEKGRIEGRTFSYPDVLIAATAKRFDLTVVTRNAKDFIVADVAVFDPWAGKTYTAA